MTIIEFIKGYLDEGSCNSKFNRLLVARVSYKNQYRYIYG